MSSIRDNLVLGLFFWVLLHLAMAVGVQVPLCVERGTTSNPFRCKVVGPTLGFLVFVAAGVVEWPIAAGVYCFRHLKGRRIMAHPATVVYPTVSDAILI